MKPSVVVVAPSPTRLPGDFGSMIAALAGDRGRVPVLVRPGDYQRPRMADLFADILDAMGRTGVSLVTRRSTPGDMALLVPFLLTDDVTDLIIFDAQWLSLPGCEELIAATSLPNVALWLVLGSTPPPELRDMLNGHDDQWTDLPTAQRAWQQSSCNAAAAPTARDAVVARLRTGASDSDTERLDLAAIIRASAPGLAFTRLDDHTRDTVGPAKRALKQMGAAWDDLADDRLRVGDLAVDASTLTVAGRTHPVPGHLRRALLRQRIHALVLGQTNERLLLTIDGSSDGTGSMSAG